MAGALKLGGDGKGGAKPGGKEGPARAFVDLVGRCRLTVSKPVLIAPMVSALEAII
jgi:hypothetical protein